MDLVDLEYSQLLIKPNTIIENVYFPTTALASLVTVLEDGSGVEAGSVGREGMVGVAVILYMDQTPMQTVTQIPGKAWRLDAGVLRKVFDQRESVHMLLNQYVHTLFVVASQSAACIRRHVVQARLARWLLMSSDGVGSSDVAITHEYLGVMLGVRRAGVTEAIGKLEDVGLIRGRRGGVVILDRPGLEAAACECYRVVKSELDRIFV